MKQLLGTGLCIIPVIGLLESTAVGGDVLDWHSSVQRNHVLVGKIWDTHARHFIEPEQFYAHLKDVDFVLLGEVHDNPDHHRLQARIIEQLARRRPAVVFEMFNRDDQTAIERVRASASAEQLAQAARMAQQGWPWRQYKPLLNAVLQNDLTLIGGDLPPAEIKAVVDKGLPALGEERLEEWALDMPLPEEQDDALRQKIAEAHCGHAQSSGLDGMVAAQRARDAALATALTQSKDSGGVLIAGVEHVRNDRGVPWYLRRVASECETASVAFVEVEADRVEASDYREAPALFDYLWFTPGVERAEPCARFER